MKRRIRKGIKTNLNELSQKTHCHISFLTKLESLEIITQEEREHIASIETTSGAIAASRCFYQLLLQKECREEDLLKSLHESNQTGAAKIFEDLNTPVWFDVHPPVSSFVGRDAHLQVLGDQLKSNQNNATNGHITVISQIRSLVGIGGIGKTELCRKYLSIYNSDCQRHAVWLNADNEGTIGDSFKNLAKYLEVPIVTSEGEERDIAIIVREVFKEFEGTQVLVIYDNCDNPELLQDQRFLPKAVPGMPTPLILITSRNSQWPNIRTILVDKFELSEAMELVQSQITKHRLMNCYSDSSCASLVELLQFFPLAIQQALAHIIQENLVYESPYTLENYIEDFRAKSSALLSCTAFQNIECNYSKTSYTTWHVTIDTLVKERKLSDQGLLLLHIVGYLDPETIRLKIFHDFMDESELKKTLDLLVSYSLLQKFPEGDSFNIHRLFQHVIRLELSDKHTASRVIESAIELVNKNETENLPIHSTAVWRFASGYPEIVQNYFTKSFYTSKQLTPLHLLSQDGNKENVKLLVNCLNAGSNTSFLDQTDEYNRSSIFIASALGHWEIVEILLSLGANPKIKSNICYSSFEELRDHVLDPTHWNPLHVAAYYNHVRIIELLMSFDDDLVDEHDSKEQTPPLIAVRVGNVDSVRVMKASDSLYQICVTMISVIKQGLNENLLNDFLDTIEGDKEMLLNQKLVEHDKWEGFDCTPIRLAIHIQAPVEILEILQRHGAKLCRYNDEYWRLLYICCTTNNVDLTEYILRQIRNPNLRIRHDEWTLLHCCAKYGSLNVMRYLNDNYNINLNVKDRHWDTPFYQAAYNGQLNIVKYMAECGADINIVNKLGVTAITAAAVNYKLDVVRYLLTRNDCKIFPWETETDKNSLLGMLQIGLLHILVAYDEVDLLDHILCTKNCKNQVLGFESGDVYGLFTLLHAAALFNTTNMIEYLINTCHFSLYDKPLNLFHCLMSFYKAGENGLFEIQYKTVVDKLIWAAHWIPNWVFCVNPAQFSVLLGIDANSTLKSTTQYFEPNFILRTATLLIPQFKEMIKLFREYLSVQKDPYLQPGKELTRLALMFRRES